MFIQRRTNWIFKYSYKSVQSYPLICCAKAQAVCSRRLPAEARVSPYEICGAPSGIGTDFFLRVLRFSPVIVIPPILHTHAALTRRTNRRSVGIFQKTMFFLKSRSAGQKAKPHRFLQYLTLYGIAL